MSGDATFAGTTYQARTVAFVCAHIVRQMRLGWFENVDDTPLAVSGETGGAGDDVRVEFGTSHPPFEAQVKHGLTGGTRLQEAVKRLVQTNDLTTGLIVDRRSSRKIHVELRADLERLRTGREDGLRPQTVELIGEFGRENLQKLVVVPLDLDRESDPDAKHALELLESSLEDPSQVTAVWSVLVADAGDVCSRKLRRDRKQLVHLLTGAGIKLRPPRKDERWHLELDFSRQLLLKKHAAAALTSLLNLEKRLAGVQAEPAVRFRIAQQKSAAYLQLASYDNSISAAREALDVDPTGVLALVNGALAAGLAGHVQVAQSFADRAVAIAPNDPNAWGAKAQVAAISGDSPPNVPQTIAESVEYRTTLAQIAFNASDWPEVLRLTQDLLEPGKRSPETLFFRATAFASIGEREGHPNLEPYRDAERLATELIDHLNDEAHPYTRKLFVVRAHARRFLGKAAEADSDLESARRIDSDDPDAIGHAARWRLHAGDEVGALQILRHPAVDDNPMLASLRARVFASQGDRLSARKDLEITISRIGDARDPDSLRLSSADVALAIDDPDLAEKLLNSVSAGMRADARFLGLRGRLLFARGDIDAGTMDYKKAAAVDAANRADYLTELASRLLKVGKAFDAVGAFDTLGETHIPPSAFRLYAISLVQADELVRAHQFIERHSEEGTLPDWGLDVAVEIATRRDDEEQAIEHIARLVEKRGTDANILIELIRRLLEQGRIDTANSYLDKVKQIGGLTSVQRMQTAQLLDGAGRGKESLAHAFRAFRDSPQDPRMHRALIFLAVRGKEPLDEPTEVSVDTHVILERQDGTTRYHTIYGDEPIDPTRNELRAESAMATELMGHKVGDVIVRYGGAWNEERWTVKEIRSALHHVVQDAMLHYEERFPGEPFFMKGFSVGDSATIKDFAPLIASLEARKQQAEGILAQYWEQALPLGMIATFLGVSISDIMTELATEERKPGVLVEWSNRDGQEESKSAALRAKEVVLTRSALHTAQGLNLLDKVGQQYTIIAPVSLRAELRREVSDARRLVVEGQHVISRGGPGLSMIELEPNHPALVKRLAEADSLLKWLESSAQILPRPLESLKSPTSRDEEVREIVGSSSFDGIVLARHRGASLYADDLGLRGHMPTEDRVRSFSSIGLVRALSEEGAVSSVMRDDAFLDLLRRRYVFMPITRELLDLVVRNWSRLPRSLVSDVVKLVGTTQPTLAEVASMAIQTVKSAVTAPVQTISTEEITLFVLEGAATRWPRSVCAHALAQVARDHLTLLPITLLAVLGVCERFRQPGTIRG